MAKFRIQHKTKLNEPSEAARKLPFYPYLPKTKVGLLKWRIYVHERCLVDLEFRRDIWMMCSQDVAFFAATFCWAHETRDDAFIEEAGRYPFIPWTDQVDILAWLQMYGGTNDISIEKTRGIGLSWTAMIYLIWKWMFSKGGLLEFGVLSKDDNSLDILGRPSTLMGKLDVLFAGLPGWMIIGPDGKTILKRTSSQSHKFENLMNGNAILGFTASDDKLRSARLNIIITDEAAYLPVDVQRWLASSQFVSSSRIFISTHDGTATMFYRLTVDEKSLLVRISTWWQDNPARARGMYVVKNGQVEIIDKTYDFTDYEFMYEDPGLPRSPWVDSEFRKPGIDMVRLKQEIYGVAAIDTKRMIQKEVTDAARKLCRPPLFRAKYVNGEFIEDLEGDFYFWEEFGFTGSYMLGVDPALGVVDAALGALVAFDVKTGAVVASAGFKEMSAVDLAQNAVWLAKELCGVRGPGHCKIIHESTGIGTQFTTEIKRLKWPNVFAHTTGTLGMPNPDKGEKVLAEYGRAIRDGDTLPMDVRIVEDLEHFEYDQKTNLVFTGLVGHGDLAQAAALAWWAGKERRKAIIDEEHRKHEVLQPIELEPGYGAARRAAKKQGWSARFALRN